MSYLLGIDVGSTNLKAVLFSTDGAIVGKGDTPTECVHPDADHPDWAVWQPEQIWGGIAQAVRQAIAGVDPAAIMGVAVTGMGMDGVPVDAAGNHLYPFISWHCPRTTPQMQWWVDTIGVEKQFAIGGDQIWPFNTALRLLWMRDNEPALLKRTHKWVLIEDYVNLRLCGEYATDYSMASNTFLFDQRTHTWSEELLRISGIDPDLLCDPRPAGTVIGQVHQAAAEATGLKVGTPVVLGGHDYSCGCLPTGAFKPGVVLDVMGTWEMIVAALDEPVLTTQAMDMGVLIDTHVARDKWAVMGATVAADMLEWFRRELGRTEVSEAKASGKVDWDLLVELAESAPVAANGIMFLPHMSGSFCPIVDPNSAGTFVGLRNIATRADMLRAMIEGLNFQFLQIIHAFEKEIGVKGDHIVAVGGPTRNRFWMQNKADMSGKQVKVPDMPEAVPLGAAILAGIGAGIYADEADAFARVYREGRVYEPDAATTDAYAEHYERFNRLYPAMSNFYAG